MKKKLPKGRLSVDKQPDYAMEIAFKINLDMFGRGADDEVTEHWAAIISQSPAIKELVEAVGVSIKSQRETHHIGNHPLEQLESAIEPFKKRM